MEENYKYRKIEDENSGSSSSDSQEIRLDTSLLSEHDIDYRPKKNRRLLAAVAIHGVLICFYTLWTLALLNHKTPTANCEPGPDLIYCKITKYDPRSCEKANRNGVTKRLPAPLSNMKPSL